VARVRELGYLDDGGFARRYAEELLGKGKSLGEIRRRLADKRIARDIIDEVLDGIQTDERPLISELISGKYAGKLSSENGRQKVYAALLRRGFRSSDIIAALNGSEVDGIEYTED
jgi:SOS response regulatory protein OraA/RecX